MGYSCRTFREELWARPCISFAEPSIKRHPPTLGGNAKRVPEPHALAHELASRCSHWHSRARQGADG
jgi:hypothetical protein